MYRDLEWFIIAPSSRIAGLCHSVLRGEPYSTCQLGCAYCYARWYRGPHGTPGPIPSVLRLVREVARAQNALGASLPIRVATLSDPFQPVEAERRLTLRLLREAHKMEVPIILNTRLPPPDGEYWREMCQLAGSGLLLLQVTLPTVWDERVYRVLEPLSPSPAERLSIIERASSLGIPVIVRAQPLIPGARTLADPTGFMETIASRGASGVIVEFLRGEREIVEAVERVQEATFKWEEYAEGARIYHPTLQYRWDNTRRLSREARQAGLSFQTCKEGLFDTHHPDSMDCCGFKLLGVQTARRPTLVDVYRRVLETGKLPIERVLEKACREVERQGFMPLCGDRLEVLPRWLRRPLVLHQRRLERILFRPNILSRLTPLLTSRDGVVQLVEGGGGGPAGI